MGRPRAYVRPVPLVLVRGGIRTLHGTEECKGSRKGEDVAKFPKIHKRFSPEPTNKILTLPNVISFLRIISIPIIMVLVMQRHLFAGLVILALSSISDGVDGFIARRYNQVTKLGQVLDPIADRLLIVCSMLALGSVDVLPWWVLLIVASREVVLLFGILALANNGYGPLPVNFVGKAGTAVLMIAVPIFIVAELGSGIGFDVLHYLGDACAIWGCCLYWMAGAIYIVQGTQVLRGVDPSERHKTSSAADGLSGAATSDGMRS